jgi:hypothetical protein
MLPLTTRQLVAAAEQLFQAGSLSQFSCLSKVRCLFKVSKNFFVDLLAQNQPKPFS